MRTDAWMMLGSGPSAGRWPIPENIPLASVNAAHNLRRPNVFGCFEYHAARNLRHVLPEMARDPKMRVFMRDYSASAANLSTEDGIIVVSKQWGPNELVDLHEDVEWGYTEPPDHGQRRSWISSGVLTLWILAHMAKPSRIYCLGLDGYPNRADDQLDYADSLPSLGFDGLDVEGKRRRREMNKRMSEGIARITSYYTDTEFIWLEEPNHLREDWNIRIANDQDLRDLYEGYED